MRYRIVRVPLLLHSACQPPAARNPPSQAGLLERKFKRLIQRAKKEEEREGREGREGTGGAEAEHEAAAREQETWEAQRWLAAMHMGAATSQLWMGMSLLLILRQG